MTRKRQVIFAEPVPPGKRWPFYRWIPNAYRANRRGGETRYYAIYDALHDWWATR